MSKNIIMQVLTSLGYEQMYPFNPSMVLNATVQNTSTSSQYNLTIPGISIPLTNIIGNNMGIIAFTPTIANISNPTISINGDTPKPILFADGSLVSASTFNISTMVFVKYKNDNFYLLLDKTQLGLSNIDNTSDLNKPISTATQNALNNKISIPLQIPRNSNLNTYQTAGLYYSSSNSDAGTMTNLPINQAFSLFIERHAGVKQTFTNYTINGIQMWIRNYYNGTWTSWVQCAMVYSGTANPDPSLGVNGNIYVKIES